MKRTALLGTEALLFAGVGYEALQLTTHRARPITGASRDTWDGPALHDKNVSFPSGHVTAAFSLATVIAHEWRDVPGIAPVAYGLASLVAVSRVNDHAHWSSDVLVAGVLGYAMGTSVEWLHQSGPHVAISPTLTRHSAAIAAEWDF